MRISETWYPCTMNSLWSETTQEWEDDVEDWRAVGTNPFERRLLSEESHCENETLYIIKFTSSRLDIAYSTSLEKISLARHVILEADRGEDCGTVIGYTTKDAFKELIRKNKPLEEYFKIKKIYRIAAEKDLKLLKERGDLVKTALGECRNHVHEKGLVMEIRDCEYQFDMNKITFFYKSDERIDFRELVKELYKVFKTRIWMCSVDKSFDKLLLEITKE